MTVCLVMLHVGTWMLREKFPNGVEFLCSLIKFYFSSVSRKGEIIKFSFSRRVTSFDDGVLGNDAWGNADAEVIVSKWG